MIDTRELRRALVATVTAAITRQARQARWMASLVVLAILAAASLSASSFSTYFAGNATNARVGVDVGGNIYVAVTERSVCLAVVCNEDALARDIVVSKLNPEATEVIWEVRVGGSGPDRLSAMFVAGDGSVYFAGETDSQDFPVTSGSLQRARPPLVSVAFVASLHSNGTVRYATFIGGADERTRIQAIAANERGEAFLTGSLVPLVVTVETVPTPFLLQLDSTGGNSLISRRGIGGGQIVLDRLGNIYVAGATSSPDYPTTPGAFQASFNRSTCGSSFGQFPCVHQYVTKLSAAGEIRYSTFLAGSFSEFNLGLAVDADGHAYVTGTTTSRDYPVTPGAFQTLHLSRTPQLGTTAPQTAFVSKLNADGSALVYSSFLGGVATDQGTAIAVDSSGRAHVAGWTSSVDFPGVPATPLRCAPRDNAPHRPVGILPFPGRVVQSFVSRVSADGSRLLGSRLINASNVVLTGLVLDPGGRAVFAADTAQQDVPVSPGVLAALRDPERTQSGVFLGRIDLDIPAAERRLNCVKDASDFSYAGPISPGEILSLFGVNLGPGEPLASLPSDSDRVATRLGGLRVTFDGIPAPLLFASAEQINLAVPYELAGSSSTLMEVTFNGAKVDERWLVMVRQNPSIFVQPDVFSETCGIDNATFAISGPVGLILNEDGTRNSCQNPAARGSVMALFVNGIGAAGPALPDGLIHRSPPALLPLPVTATVGGQPAPVTFAGGAPGAIAGVWQVNIHIAEDASSFGSVVLLRIGSLLVRQGRVAVWIRQ